MKQDSRCLLVFIMVVVFCYILNLTSQKKKKKNVFKVLLNLDHLIITFISSGAGCLYHIHHNEMFSFFIHLLPPFTDLTIIATLKICGSESTFPILSSLLLCPQNEVHLHRLSLFLGTLNAVLLCMIPCYNIYFSGTWRGEMTFYSKAANEAADLES